MSRISRLVVLVTSLAAVFAAMAGTAGAVTWHVNGTGSFTATSGPGTLGATGLNLACASSSATGSYAPGSTVGNVYSGITGKITFSNCLLAGQSSEVSCDYRLTATTQPTVTTTTTGLADVTCGVTVGSIKNCHIQGSVHAVYTDSAAPTADVLTVSTSGTGLRIGGNTCLVGTNEPAHLNETTFRVTSNGGNGPHIVRTA